MSTTGSVTLQFKLLNSYGGLPLQNIYYLDDVKVADITTVNAPLMLAHKDYYPFGMPMPERNIEGEYRYAYQGQEKDPETGMEAFELRLWDARIGRWLNTDPAGQYNSPYLGMGNNPISRVDPDGGFDSRLGAWLYKVWHGTGGKIFENEHGSWGIDLTNGNYEDGVNSIFGWNWEKNNLNRFAIGHEVQGTLTFASFMGSDTNFSIQQVYFPKFNNQLSFYSSVDSGPKLTSEVDISAGIGENYFISYYNGDPDYISPENYAGKYWSMEGAIGVSAVANVELHAGYIQSLPDKRNGVWKTIFVGSSASIGLQVGTTDLISISGSNQHGRSHHLFNTHFPIGNFINSL